MELARFFFETTLLACPLLRILAQQQPQCQLAGAIGRSRGLEKDFRAIDRAVSASTINFPLPRLRRRGPVLYDNREVLMIDHVKTLSPTTFQMAQQFWRHTVT